MTTLEAEVVELKPVEEIVLEPVHAGGELVSGDWWEAPTIEPVSLWRRHLLFVLTIILPITIGSVYFGFLTGDRYVSEAHFLVRTASHDEVGNLASLMQNQKLSRAADETYAVVNYMTSRDALALVGRDGFIQQLLSRPEAGPFERFPSPFFLNNEEHLYRGFKGLVTAKIDSESGIGTLSVTAFTASDAQKLATTLLEGGEQLINRLNARAHDDALSYAEKNVDTAKRGLVEAEDRLAQFRNTNRIIAPDREASLSLGSMTKMRTELADLRASLHQKMVVTPRSPALALQREQIKALQHEIDQMRKGVAGSSTSMAAKLGTYEKLMLDRSLAAKQLEASTKMLDSAERDARQQQLYVETIVAPGLPDQALYPYRILSILLVIIGSFALRWFVGAVGRTILEHRA